MQKQLVKFFSMTLSKIDLFLECLDWTASKLWNIFSQNVNPFTTPFFTVLNYRSLSTLIEKKGLKRSFLILNVVYFSVTLYLACYKNYNLAIAKKIA